MATVQTQKQPQNIHQFLDDQLINTVNLLKQNTILGTTHILYNKAIIDGILNDLKNIHQTLVNLANPPSPAQQPKKQQKTPPKENKIEPPSTTKKNN